MTITQRYKEIDIQYIMDNTPAGRIRELLNESGWQQYELADRIGKHATLISKYLSGKPAVSYAFARTLQDRVGWSAAYIMDGIGPKHINLDGIPGQVRQIYAGEMPYNATEKNINNGKANLWIVPVSAQGGFIKGFYDRLFSHKIQRITFPFIAGECFGFEVEGYSMFLPDDPVGSFPEGSYVICTINEDVDSMRVGTAYIFQTRDGLLLKVFNGVRDREIALLSLNPDHNPVPPLPVEELLVVYNIELKLGRAKVNWARTLSLA